MSDLPIGFLLKNNTGTLKMVSNILLCKVCEELTRMWNINRDLVMPKRTVDTVNPEIKNYHSAQDLWLIFNDAKGWQAIYKDTMYLSYK